MIDRRQFLSHFGTALLASTVPSGAHGGDRLLALPVSHSVRLRSAADYGVRPDALENQSTRFQAMLDAAAREGVPVFLPAGNYVLSNMQIASGVLLHGVPGRTRIIYGGEGYLFRAENAETIVLKNLILDGVDGWMAPMAKGLVDIRNSTGIVIEDCRLLDAGGNGVYLEGCAGRLRGNTISGARQFAIFAMESRGLMISDNILDANSDGGIVVHRWSQGQDGTIITGNRISDTGAESGGTGQWGNAINLFRTEDVIISGNMISGSAFSAIRGNSASGLQIIGNNCRDSGETAIYAEFSFENAVVANNIIDGAANGISVTNFDHGGRAAVVSGNIIRNLSTSGPYEPAAPGFGTGIAVEADTTVTGNVIEGAPLNGINAGWGRFLRDVVISANTIRDSGTGIAVSAVEGAGHALVRENIISARNGAIVAHAWGKPVSGDLAVNPGMAPPNILVSGNTAT